MNNLRSVRPSNCRTPGLPVALFAAWTLVLAIPSPGGAAGPADSKRKEATQQRAAPKGEKWQRLFDGRSLGKWKVIDKLDYARHGKVHVHDGRLVLEAGKPATGIRWTGPFPKIDYEVTLEAMRVEGEDFFCALTFPVGEAALTLVVGGWHGSVVGLSSIDGEPAVENESCTCMDFQQNRWYRLRLRESKPKIEAWIDKDKLIDFAPEGRKLTLYWEMEPALPFGVATWYTTGALRDFRVRPIKPTPACGLPQLDLRVPRLACPTVLTALLGKPAVAHNVQGQGGETLVRGADGRVSTAGLRRSRLRWARALSYNRPSPSG